MKNELHKRIWSALLVLVLVLQCMPLGSVRAELTGDAQETAATETAEVTEAAEITEATETTETAETTEAADHCPYCEETVAEDGTVTHGLECTAAYVYDGTADVGKYVRLIPEIAEYGVEVSSSHSSDDSLYFYYDEFGTDTVMRITDWYWDAGNTGLWYQVELYAGAFPESTEDYTWPEPAWILQDYTDTTYEYDAVLEFVTIELPETGCDICGKEDCTGLHFYCSLCDSYDCTLPHLYCSVCEIFDCTASHTWCGTCGCFDCGLEHEDLYTPDTEPVIPEDPDLTADVSVFIIQENGEPVPEEGLVVEEGRKVSLSAWGNASWCAAEEASVSYRWQIRYDKDLWQWADIQGQTGKGILVSAALFHSLQDREPAIRCVITSGTQERFSAPVALRTVQTATLEEPVYEASVTDTENTPLADEDTVDVFIQYEFYNGTPASNPRVSNLPKGKAYATQNPITVPNIPGYRATLGESAVGTITLVGDQLTISFTAEEMNQDRTVRIIYQPAEVNVVLRYYWQNLNDDNYTEKEHETIQVITNQNVPDVTKEYPGFRRLEYEKTRAAADGSTEVKVYFDREYYLMEFELGGGYGVEPVYARYGTPITVNDPVRPGYRFDGWDTTIPATMPEANRTYQATWTPMDVSYKVAYWIANDDGTRTLLGTDIKWGTADDTVDGIDNLGATDNNGNTVTDRGVICGNDTEHVHTIACYGCGQEPHKHDRTCFANNYTSNNASDSDLNAIFDVKDGNENPESGYVYVIKDSNNRYWPKLYLEDSKGIGSYWTVDTINGTSDWNDVLDMVEEGTIGEAGSYETLTATKYKAKPSCGKEQHAHTDSELTCPQHGHDPETCYQDTTHMRYVDAVTVGPEDGRITYTTGKGVTIKGDNTTVVDVYYVYKKYTIRYVYARQSTAGDDYRLASSTGNGDYSNTNQVIWSYPASALPKVTDPDGSETPKFFTEGSYKYYYISLTATYGEDIASKWPSANVESTGGYDFGSWGAGPDSPYRQKYGNEHANIVGPYPVMSDEMIDPDPAELSDNTYLAQTMVAWWGASGDHVEKHAYHIYLELVLGETQVAGGTYKKYNGKTYRLDKTYTFTAAHNGNTRVDPLQLDGLIVVNEDKNKQANSGNYNNEGNCSICGTDCSYCNDYFYDSISYTLSFWNHDGYLGDGSGSSTRYRTPLISRFNYDEVAEDGKHLYGANQLVQMPENYPESLEPDAYVFEGWYTSPQFAADTKVTDEIAETMRMPAENLMLYAHWVPKEYTVTILDQKGGAVLKTVAEVQHGSTIEEHEIKNPTAPADKSGFKYVGWFYEENGVEKAFDFANSPVKGDMTIYAKWSANVLCPFEVRFVLASNHNVQIADSITGTIMAGSRTVDAKGGTDLYEDYQTGYFPNQKSHTVVPKIEVDAEGKPKTIVYTFEYTPLEKVPYTVQYLIRNADGTTRPALIVDSGSPGYRPAAENEPATSEAYVKEDENNVKAVVTETYIPITGYLPVGGTYQQTLVVTPDGNNEIIFYYEKDTEHALVQINHYIQNLDGETWSEYQTSTLTGDIGKPYSQTAIDIPHFTFSDSYTKQYNITEPKDPYLNAPLPDTVTFDEGTDTVSGTLGQTGLQLNLYYTRNTYSYKVQYLEQSSGAVLHDTKTVNAKYHAYVTENYVVIQKDLDGDGKNEDFQLYEASQPTQSALIQDNNTIITFYYVRCTQNLTVTKTVVDANGTDAYAPDENLTYSFRLVLHANDFSHQSSYKYVLKEGDTQVDAGYISVTTVADGNPYLAFSLKDGQTITFLDLPTAEYSVEELSAPVGYYTTYAPAQKNALTVNAQVDVTVTNTYDPAALVISKTVEEVESSNLPEVTEFQFTVTFPAEITPENQYTYTVSYTPEGQTTPVEETKTFYVSAGAGTITLKKGETARFNNLPTGVYKVTEENYASQGYKTSYIVNSGNEVKELAAEVKLTRGNTSRVDFTNKFPVGNLQIQKTVTKEFSGTAWGGDEFQFTVSRYKQELTPGRKYELYLDGNYVTEAIVNADKKLVVTIPFGSGDAEALRTAGAEATHILTIENLPEGTYIVDEEADASYTQSTLHVEALAVVPNVPKAEFTNELKLPKGNLYLAKELKAADDYDGPMEEGKLFTFTIQAEDKNAVPNTAAVEVTQGETTVQKALQEGVLTVQLEEGESMTIKGLPISQYRIIEATEPRYANSFSGAATQADVDADKWSALNSDAYDDGRLYTVITVTQEETTYVKCTNEYPVDTTKLILHKKVTKESEENIQPDNENFVFTVTLSDTEKTSYPYQLLDAEGNEISDETATVADGAFTVTLKDGQYAVFAHIPACSCTVTETVGAEFGTSYQEYLYTAGQTVTLPVDTTTVTPDGTGTNGFTKTLAAGTTELLVFTNHRKILITYNSNYPTDLNQANVTASAEKAYGEDYSIETYSDKDKVIVDTPFVADGYYIDSWNTKSDGSGTKYEPGAIYTDNQDLTLYAQWLDARLGVPILVGINMSFYSDADNNLYYTFPIVEGLKEPVISRIDAARVYIDAADGNKWKIQTEGYDGKNRWSRTLPGNAADYIKPIIFTTPASTTSAGTKTEGFIKRDYQGNVYVQGVFDESGIVNKTLLKFTESDYTGIIQAWIDELDWLKTTYKKTNVDWAALSRTASDYEVIPYVIKKHHNESIQEQAWHVDVIIVPKAKYSVKYELGLADGYTATEPKDPNQYGKGYYANVAEFHNVTRSDNSDYVAIFKGWEAKDANGNSVEIVNGKISMPASNVTLTALWEYPVEYTVQYHKKDLVTGNYDLQEQDTVVKPAHISKQQNAEYDAQKYTGFYFKEVKPADLKITADGQVFDVYYDPNTLTITQTGVKVNESRIYHVSGGTVDMYVEIQENKSVTIEQIPAGDYTVTELTNWTWKDGNDTNEKNITVNPGPNEVPFDYSEVTPDWLGGETSKNNTFAGTPIDEEQN